MDTALVLQLRSALTLLEHRLNTLIGNLARLADAHRTTLMAGRTHGQHALPLTFGLKVAGWLAPLLRHRERLDQLKPRLLVVQFGGAVGTIASLGDQGMAVQEALAQELGLGVPLMPWHSQRDTLAEFAGWLSLVSGSLAKMAQDIILLAQSEVAEVRESGDSSRGSSSTMPQKRNPVISQAILAAAHTNAALLSSMHGALVHEHERATSAWQVEWLTLPQMVILTAAVLNKTLFLSENLVVDADRMQANLAGSNGLLMAEAIDLALSPIIGRTEAKQIIRAAVPVAVEQNRHLVDVVRERVRERVDADIDWERLLSEANYLGSSDAFINRVLQQAESSEHD
jgi:3-carboxy-cis,cis-muconate cycloisomerase